ncbi:MAG TPA: hypothetical protein VND92_06820 [Vicinamibacterales bacterium]|nr:hypothetical protein [Vicinamibacterales bacterium]
MDPLEEIKRLYYETRRATIARDLARAVELLKSMPSEEDRERAAAFMDGLSQMRSEWGVRGGTEPGGAKGGGQRRSPRRR